MDTLVKGITSADTGAKNLKSGVDTYTKGADTLADGVSAYVTGAGQYTGAVNSYLSGEETLNTGVQNFASQAGTLPASLKSLYGAISSAKTGSDALADEETTTKLTTGSKAVSDGITSLNTSINDILKDMKENGGELPSSTEIDHSLTSSEAAFVSVSVSSASLYGVKPYSSKISPASSD